MDFTSEHYYRASLERMRQAQELYRTEASYALTMYVAGVAVECMLRAYRLKKTTEFESRHDVVLLFKECGLLSLDPDKLRRKGLSEEETRVNLRTMEHAIRVVFALWHNNYRYASEARLLAHLKRLKLYRGVRGDVLKANAIELLKAAQLFVDTGTQLWH